MNPAPIKREVIPEGAVSVTERARKNEERKKELINPHNRMLPVKFRVDVAVDRRAHGNIKTASGYDCALKLEIELI